MAFLAWIKVKCYFLFQASFLAVFIFLFLPYFLLFLVIQKCNGGKKKMKKKNLI